VSRTPARYRKPSSARPSAAGRHGKSAPVVSVLRGKTARMAAAAIAVSAVLASAVLASAVLASAVLASAVLASAVLASAVLASAGPAAAHWMAGAPNLAWVDQADALGAQLGGSLGAQVSQQPEIVSADLAPAPGYLNPLRGVSGLNPERIDMGADFSGSGPVYALGDAVITSATGDSAGWPGGGWITYQLTEGPDAGLMVYVAEDVTPVIQVGQHVSSSTVIATMHDGGDGIEIGWAQPTDLSAESQLPEAGAIDGYGPFPTKIGLNFDDLLQSLGVPAAPNSNQPAYGLLPANYPANGGIA
jgi:hypothetical protein